MVPRVDKPLKFTDRNVADVPDGYVACESQSDPRTFTVRKYIVKTGHFFTGSRLLWHPFSPSTNVSFLFQTIESMEHAMQAVPVLVDSSSQTELKHPKNVHTQYEPRVFSQDEVDQLAKSKEMNKFLTKAVDV